MTLTLKFDLLLRNFYLGCYLMMLAARRASLSSDNSYINIPLILVNRWWHAADGSHIDQWHHQLQSGGPAGRAAVRTSITGTSSDWTGRVCVGRGGEGGGGEEGGTQWYKLESGGTAGRTSICTSITGTSPDWAGRVCVCTCMGCGGTQVEQRQPVVQTQVRGDSRQNLLLYKYYEDFSRQDR